MRAFVYINIQNWKVMTQARPQPHQLVTAHITTAMANFRFIPEPQKRLIIIMLEQGKSPKEISLATRFSMNTVYRVRKLWSSTGSVVKRAVERGRPRTLTSLEVEVS